MTERPHLYDLIGQVVILHFPNGDFTTGRLAFDSHDRLNVNGWLVDLSGRWFSHNGKTYTTRSAS